MTRGPIDSFNAGYHRGLHTEYHGKDVHDLYVDWIESRYVEEPDPQEFTEGYWEGFHDYERTMIEIEMGKARG